MATEDICDLLLDFTSESAYDARIAKHECVQTLWVNHGVLLVDVLSEEEVDCLQDYAAQGPCFVPNLATMEIDREGSAQ